MITHFIDYNGADTHIKSAQVIAGAKVYYDGFPSTAPYKIQLELAQMITFSTKDPYAKPLDANGNFNDGALLGVFREWKSAAGITADVIHLMVGTPFTQAAGWGFVGTACGVFNAGETDGTMSDGSMAAVAAHELGHILGMEHDDVVVPTLGRDCSSNPGRMGRRLDSFSSCSVEWVRIKYAPGSTKYNNIDYPACLEARDYSVITGTTAVCGNGVLEGNEQCDCPNGDCTGIDPCCNGATCMLKTGFTCSATWNKCCDPNTCKSPLPSGTVCRAGRDSCDPVETCTGASVNCPSDQRLSIGETCLTPTLGVQGTCTCDGCQSMEYTCKQRDPSYTTCSSECGDAWCDDGTGCYSWGDPLHVGQKCGDGKSCNAAGMCVPKEEIVCPWMTTKAPTAPTPPTTRSPTGSNPTLGPTRSPTKAPRSLCGNGIVEIGEQCDCGGNCAADTCCDGTTCQYKPQATCSKQDKCCNTATCGVASSGTTCRGAIDSCDIAETCNGVSKSCPADTRKPLGTSCTTPVFGTPGTCNCDGCTSADEKCKATSSAYSICSWKSTGDDVCGQRYCFTGNVDSCTTWGDFNALGYTCGAGMGCSADNKCVPLSAIQCPYMVTPAPTPLVPIVSIPTNIPTTKPPTNDPTKLPTNAPTKLPTTPTLKPTTARPTTRRPTTRNPTRFPTRLLG